MNRHASVALRRTVDDAVGPSYDRAFLRLDLLLASREGRCACAACSSWVAEECERLIIALPPVG